MFLSGQVTFFSQLVLGQVVFCNLSTALLCHNIGQVYLRIIIHINFAEIDSKCCNGLAKKKIKVNATSMTSKPKICIKYIKPD